MTAAILSLSLLTAMAGAAIAPALDVIRAHFADSSALMVQMIISTPALFIVLTSLIFPRLCRRFGSKGLVLVSLILYALGGCGVGAVQALCGNIAHLPYWYAAVLALLFLLCSVFLPKEPSSPEEC